MISRKLISSVAPLLAATMLLVGGSPLASAQERLSQGGSAPAVANQTKPVVVATIGSLNKLMADVNYVSAMVGQPQAGGMFAMIAGSMAQGIDMDQPIGIMVSLVDGMPQPLAVLPTADVKSVLQRLEAQTGGAEELDDGTLVIAIGVNTVYIKQVGSWAALAPKKETLALAPADPTVYFEGLGNGYDLAARVQMQQVPMETRQILIDQLRQGFDQTMERSDANDAARESAEAQIEQLERVISETDEFMFGLNVDKSANEVYQDFSFTAVEGSSLASAYGGQTLMPSKFASVIREDAAMYYHASISIPEEAVEQAEAQVEQSVTMMSSVLEQNDDMSAEDKQLVKDLMRSIVDLSLETAREGHADIGALLLADESQGRFVLGTRVSDGAKVAKLLTDFAAKIEGKPDAPTFIFNDSVYNSVAMHRVEADVPAKMDEARKIFGDKLTVHIGTADKAVYVAVGKDSLAMIQDLIDAPVESSIPADRTAGKMQIKMLPILEYSQTIESNNTISAMIDALLNANDTGNLRLISRSIPNGGAGRLTWSEGLLKAIGAAIAENQPQPPGGF